MQIRGKRPGANVDASSQAIYQEKSPYRILIIYIILFLCVCIIFLYRDLSKKRKGETNGKEKRLPGKTAVAAAAMLQLWLGTFVVGGETFYASFYNSKPATSGYPKGATVEEVLSAKCPCCGKVSPVNENDLPVGVPYKIYIYI